jgi:Fe-S-cluster containining protein
MPEPYLKLRGRVDQLGAAITETQREHLRCEPGCCDCCVGGLTLVAVEAVVLGAELGLPAEQVRALIGEPPVAASGHCALLDGNGRCGAYSARPIVCRTEGLPLDYPAPTGIVSCEKNFKAVVPDRNAAFDMTNLETALFAVNLDYCRRHGADPLGRVAIDRIAAAVKVLL